MNQFQELQKLVYDTLHEKNFSVTPKTLRVMLHNAESAFGFISTSEFARTRYDKISNDIVNFIAKLEARDMRSASQSIHEDGLSSEAMMKRALLHAGKVYQLSELKWDYARRLSEINAKIDKSLSSIPFAQRAEFSALLVTLAKTGDMELSEE